MKHGSHEVKRIAKNFRHWGYFNLMCYVETLLMANQYKNNRIHNLQLYGTPEEKITSFVNQNSQ